MADILIHGISIPRERDHLTITINADGTVQPLVDMYCPIIAHAIELPEHGDLIEAEPIKRFITDGLNSGAFGYDQIKVLTEIEYAPVIVPSNKEETE